MKGKLYVVSTPIGNIEDISLRAIRILKEVDLIACEDTRNTRKLLSHYQIKKPLTSYHEHNEKEKAKQLLRHLRAGKNIALVSDAGTPGISDPGFRLVKIAAENEIDVISVPGPSAAVAALSISGLPTSSFGFFGFPPKTNNKKEQFLKDIKDLDQTLIFYESSRRIVDTLSSIIEVFGDRQISVSRELTKVFEETIMGKISDVIEKLREKKELKGEFTVVVEGNKDKHREFSIETLERDIRSYKDRGFSLKKTVEELAMESKLPKNQLYREALKIWNR
ncbi:MAG: 16S rRNA (cytidine(1402)-2'-O)-methyltransferase [Thermodesulfobacteriota bacterium]